MLSADCWSSILKSLMPEIWGIAITCIMHKWGVRGVWIALYKESTHDQDDISSFEASSIVTHSPPFPDKIVSAAYNTWNKEHVLWHTSSDEVAWSPSPSLWYRPPPSIPVVVASPVVALQAPKRTMRRSEADEPRKMMSRDMQTSRGVRERHWSKNHSSYLLSKTDPRSGIEWKKDEGIGCQVLVQAFIQEPVRVKQ